MLDVARVQEVLQDTQTPHGSSRESMWRRCRFAHHLAYVEGVKPQYEDVTGWGDSDDAPERPAYFGVGQILHSALAYLHHGYGDPGDVIAYLLEAPDEHALANVVEAERLLDAYLNHHNCAILGPTWAERCGWAAGTEMLACERYVEQQCGVLPVTTRLDLVVKLPDGTIAVVDHKSRSTAPPGGCGGKRDSWRYEEWIKGKSVTPQVVRASWLAQREWQLSAPPPVIVNVTVKTKVPQFDRALVEVKPETVQRWLAQRRSEAQQQVVEQREYDNFTHLPLQNWDACAPELGSRCQYFNWCHGTDYHRERYYTQAKGKT